MPWTLTRAIVRWGSEVAVTCVRYEADGWGVGELWVDGRRVVWHELPRPEAALRSTASARSHAPRGDPRPPTKTVASRSERVRDEFVPNLVTRLQAFFGGADEGFHDVELDLDGLTGFGRECVRALRRVPRGEVLTYGELAALAGRPRAARAAGTFCANNRFAVFVPCHRVVGAHGIGGYGSLGVDYKRRLLALERVAL
jgi:methylated-DNA-[protein]-cysteine S-methyltransferase